MVKPLISANLGPRRLANVTSLIQVRQRLAAAMTETVTYAFAPAPQAALPIIGTAAMFPVNRVFCVGRNYAAHARELGHDPTCEPPFFFQKNPDCLTTDGTFPLPPDYGDVHHEIELAVALHSGGVSIASDDALTHVYGYAVALDMTRRSLQAELKRFGRPWEIAKAFAASAPCSAIARVTDIGHPHAGAISLAVNGTPRQSGDLADMIWSVPNLIAKLSRHFTLRSGDLILTGTPEGVGPIARGDKLAGRIAGVGELSVLVV
jgi:fumarylpyruvate hydrolase